MWEKTTILFLALLFAYSFLPELGGAVTGTCGNSVCEEDETYLTCSDCPKPVQYYSVSNQTAFCGNNICDNGESYLTCSDCPKPVEYYSFCGNDVCEYGESYLTCSDCPKPSSYYSLCGNGICESGESYLTCSDCPKPVEYYTNATATCGNNICDSGESYLSCSDCPKPVEYYSTSCTDSDGGINYYLRGTTTGPGANGNIMTVTDFCGGNNFVYEHACNPNAPYNLYEDNYQCPNGCADGACVQPPFCGNNICDSGESYLTCSDCGKPVEYYASCGNGIIESGETPENCCVDTRCGPGETCSKIMNKCVVEADEMPKEKVANALLKAEELKIKLETLEYSANGISLYYTAKGDTHRAEAWGQVAELFKTAKLDAENIKTEIRNNKGSMTEKKLENIRRLAEVINVRLTSAIDKILGID